MVALDDEGNVLGTAALKPRSVAGRDDLGPWLAALLVPAGRRGRGIGRALIAAIEGHARRLGYTELYAGMSMSESRLLAGWTEIARDAATLREPVSVFRRDLAADAGSA